MDGITLPQFRDSYCYYYVAHVREPFALNVHDGDTFTAVLDLGTDKLDNRFKIRPIGYNSPEVVGVDRAAGLAARDWLIGLFAEMKEARGRANLALKTIKNLHEVERKTGDRYLAHVWIESPDGMLRDLWKMMVNAGFGTIDSR